MPLRYDRNAFPASFDLRFSEGRTITDLRQMRHVIAVADHGNFARAAEALHLSQPALSRSVQSVEREFGGQLFRRTTAGAEPTDLGRLFLLRARTIVQMSDELGVALAHDRALLDGHVGVGGGPWSGHATLARAVTRFVALHPAVAVHLSIRDWDELLHLLRGRELDLVVAETSTCEHDVDVDVEPMQAHPLFLVARAGHPLAGDGPVSVEQCFDYPLAAMSRIPPRVLEPVRAAQRRRGGLPAVRSIPAIHCSSLSVVKQLVAGTDAITVAMFSSVRDELESGRFVLLGTEPWLTTHYGVVTLRNRPLSPAAMRLRELIRAAEQEVVDEERMQLEALDGMASAGGSPV